GNFQPIKNVFGQAKLLSRAIFGHIPREQDKAQATQRIDVADGCAQVFLARGGTNMRIAQPGETEGIGLRGNEQRQEEAERDEPCGPGTLSEFRHDTVWDLGWILSS